MTNYAKRKLQGQFIRYGAVAILAILLVAAIKAPPANAEVAIFDALFGKATILSGSDAITTESFDLAEVAPRPEALKVMRVGATAYTSRPQETDGSPYITADGSVVRDGIIATNVLPFGTKVRIPSVYGDKIFEVHDRMNARYTNRIDVWMDDVHAMNQFGIKRNIQLEVIEWGDGTKQWDQWKGRSVDYIRIGKYGPPDPPLPQPYAELATANEV